jgi:hypothetical protein
MFSTLPQDLVRPLVVKNRSVELWRHQHNHVFKVLDLIDAPEDTQGLTTSVRRFILLVQHSMGEPQGSYANCHTESASFE